VLRRGQRMAWAEVCQGRQIDGPVCAAMKDLDGPVLVAVVARDGQGGVKILRGFRGG
jgi:hypothetical protein